MKEYSRYELFCIWHQWWDHYWNDVNRFCKWDDKVFYILTEFMENFGVVSYDELMTWVETMNMGPGTLCHIYEVADEDINTFVLYMEDCFNTYMMCYKENLLEAPQSHLA